MEEQGESVFREDGWLPTTFILKAHHSFFSDSCLGCWWLTSPGPARFSDNNEAGMAGSVPSPAAQSGNANVAGLEGLRTALVPLSQQPLPVGQAGRK